MDKMQEGITGTVRSMSALLRESQGDVGNLLGLSPVTVAQRLNGRLEWSLRDVTKLCEHYGLTFDELTAGPLGWLKAARQGGASSGVNHL